MTERFSQANYDEVYQELMSPDEAAQMAENWQYGTDGLTEKPRGRLHHYQEAQEMLGQDGPLPDTAVTHAVGLAINAYRDKQLAERPGNKAMLSRMETALTRTDIPDEAKPQMERHAQSLRNEIEAAGDTDGPAVNNAIIDNVSKEVAEQDRSAVQATLRQRIEADRYPWTMPGAETSLHKDTLDGIKKVHESLTRFPEAAPDDIYTVAPPMEKFEGGVYSPGDRALLEKGNIANKGIRYTRAELQGAGVFFVNRVGGGEQPIFGMPIPDPDSEGGFFNVQDRSFLTREEFDKVYKYQQENGYGLKPGQDPADVQLDMVMYAVLPNPRDSNTVKGGGFGGRENKYSQARSPFVDLGYSVNYALESRVRSADGYDRRMNTTSIHLVNAHPDYPGVSEMFDSERVAHDQKYMSAGEFVDKFYEPLPDEEQAFHALSHDWYKTRREQNWTDTTLNPQSEDAY